MPLGATHHRWCCGQGMMMFLICLVFIKHPSSSIVSAQDDDIDRAELFTVTYPVSGAPTSGTIVYGGNLDLVGINQIVSISDNSFYVLQEGKHSILKVNLSNIPTSGPIDVSVYIGDPTTVMVPPVVDGSASVATFPNPQQMFLERSTGDLYFTVNDGGANCKLMRARYNSGSPIVQTMQGGVCGNSKVDNTGNLFHSPYGVVILPDTNAIMSDPQIHEIRRVDPVGGWGMTIAGCCPGPTLNTSNALAGHVDGPWYRMNTPMSLSLTSDGNYVYIADSGNRAIRRLLATSPWTMNTIYQHPVVGAPVGDKLDCVWVDGVSSGMMFFIANRELYVIDDPTLTTVTPRKLAGSATENPSTLADGMKLAGRMKNPGCGAASPVSPWFVFGDDGHLRYAEGSDFTKTKSASNTESATQSPTPLEPLVRLQDTWPSSGAFGPGLLYSQVVPDSGWRYGSVNANNPPSAFREMVSSSISGDHKFCDTGSCPTNSVWNQYGYVANHPASTVDSVFEYTLPRHVGQCWIHVKYNNHQSFCGFLSNGQFMEVWKYDGIEVLLGSALMGCDAPGRDNYIIIPAFLNKGQILYLIVTAGPVSDQNFDTNAVDMWIEETAPTATQTATATLLPTPTQSALPTRSSTATKSSVETATNTMMSTLTDSHTQSSRHSQTASIDLTRTRTHTSFRTATQDLTDSRTSQVSPSVRTSSFSLTQHSGGTTPTATLGVAASPTKTRAATSSPTTAPTNGTTIAPVNTATVASTTAPSTLIPTGSPANGSSSPQSTLIPTMLAPSTDSPPSNTSMNTSTSAAPATPPTTGVVAVTPTSVPTNSTPLSTSIPTTAGPVVVEPLYQVQCRVTLSIAFSDFGLVVEDFKAALGRAFGVPATYITILSVLPGSTVVNFTVAGNRTTNPSTFRSTVEAVLTNPPDFLTAIVGTILDFAVALVEFRLPAWLYGVVGVVSLISLAVVACVVRHQAKRGKLQTQLFRPAEVDVAVRFGRLYIDGETVLSDGEFAHETEIVFGGEHDDVFVRESSRFAENFGPVKAFESSFRPNSPKGPDVSGRQRRTSSIEVAAAQWRVIVPCDDTTEVPASDPDSPIEKFHEKEELQEASDSSPVLYRRRRSSLVSQQPLSPLLRSPASNPHTAPPTPNRDAVSLFSPPSEAFDDARDCSISANECDRSRSARSLDRRSSFDGRGSN